MHWMCLDVYAPEKVTTLYVLYKALVSSVNAPFFQNTLKNSLQFNARSKQTTPVIT